MAQRHKKSTKKPVKRGGSPKPGKPIALYYWPTPNGHKISIMLEELGVAYKVIPININKGEQFAPAFLKIAPNNRIPAILDPAGPGGKPISVFESGAILQYLGRKYGRFYPQAERQRVQVEEWLFWQKGGLGPMAGQANHFINSASEDLPYAKKRYSDEVHRLFGVMNTRLAGRKFLAGAYSIADIACWSWVLSASRYTPIDDFPHLKAWRDRVGARPAVQRGKALGAELRKPITDADRKVLFGQRAR
ncbi:MAG TPA: glutathione S-transferase N-terminal domain-containing protein [Rhizomicrobium sp.]|nr:glutathione S-transferase N-terminal domain-containing protein [Rhizomicrobium sp.]